VATDYHGFIERGDNVPTLVVILKLARALQIDASELVAEFTLAVVGKMEL
jgi:transcriptional regulator with XRE-family HTH domain